MSMSSINKQLLISRISEIKEDWTEIRFVDVLNIDCCKKIKLFSIGIENSIAWFPPFIISHNSVQVGLAINKAVLLILFPERGMAQGSLCVGDPHGN